MKSLFTKNLKKIFFYLGVYKFIRRNYPNKRLAILRYHAVVDPKLVDYTFPGICLSPNDFEKHVQYFSQNYTVLSFHKAMEMVKENDSLPLNALAFTFDDGYADNFIAANILKKYNASGLFYLTVKPVIREEPFWLSELVYLINKSEVPEITININGENATFAVSEKETKWSSIIELTKIIKQNNRIVRESVREQLRKQLGSEEKYQYINAIMLSVDQVNKMLEMEMEIGSHTLTHLNLPNAGDADARMEICQSRIELEKLFQKSILHFSYPNSGPYAYFNETIKQFVEACGYLSSTTSNQGFVDANSDFYALNRVRTVPELYEVVHSLEWERFVKNI